VPTVEAGVGENAALRVLVVAEDWCWREAVLRVLERHGMRAVADSVRGAVDVAVVDVDDAEGVATLTALRARGVPCLAVGSCGDDGEVAGALRVSASYALKSELDPERLAHLVHVAASADALFVHASRHSLQTLSRPRGLAERFNLTPREVDVLRELAVGRTNAEIAAQLHLAPSSVKKLVSRCLARLGVRNRVEAALLARREGLAPLDVV
jgi:DNA-binding NarL/FixJ family response regulator